MIHLHTPQKVSMARLRGPGARQAGEKKRIKCEFQYELIRMVANMIVRFPHSVQLWLHAASEVDVLPL